MLKKRKRGLKILLTVIAVILICLIGLQIGISPLAKKIVSQKVSPLFGDKLKIGSIGISIFRGSLIIKDIKLLQPPGFSKKKLSGSKSNTRAHRSSPPVEETTDSSRNYHSPTDSQPGAVEEWKDKQYLLPVKR